MFLQPDWWEVTKPGVGTNRYSYSFNDPVNGKDSTGHSNTNFANSGCCNLGSTFSDFMKSLFSGLTTSRSDADVAANAHGTAEKMKENIKNGTKKAGAALAMGILAGVTDGAALDVEALEFGAVEVTGTGAVVTSEGSIVAGAGAKAIKTEASAANSARSTVQANRAIHQAAVDARVAELEAKGYTVQREVTLTADGKVARIDLVASRNGVVAFAEEVKTGAAPDFARAQKHVYEAMSCGSACPMGNNAAALGLKPGIPLNAQGGGIPYSIFRP